MKQLLFALTIVSLTIASLFIFQQKSLPQIETDKLYSYVPIQVYHEYQVWKHQYAKQYQSQQEDNYRLQIFYENYQIIKNQDPSSGYTLAMNQFMDLPNVEWVAQYLGGIEVPMNDTIIEENSYITDAAPASVNWTALNKVSPVKNQGQCGSCWAFSATGGMESADAIFGSGVGDFSEQQLVDCSTASPNQGCNGGNFFVAWNYVIANGIQTEQAYPYTGVDGTCKVKGGAFKIKSTTKNTASSCTALQTSIAKQPTSVFVNAQTWQFYSTGIFSNCAQNNQDHMVLATGYNSNSWYVKNSWGVSWGMQGYIQLASGNTCGICYYTGVPNL